MPLLCEVLVEVDFLGGHALGLHHRAGLAALRDLANFGQGLGRIAGPDNLAARAAEVVLELQQVLVEAVRALWL